MDCGQSWTPVKERWTFELGSVRHSPTPSLSRRICEAKSKAGSFTCIFSFGFHNWPLAKGRHDCYLYFCREDPGREGGRVAWPQSRGYEQ